MPESLQFLIETVATGAEKYFVGYDEEFLLDLAAQNWSEVDEEISRLRPILSETKRFLKDVIRAVLKEIVTKYKDLSVVTLTVATQQLIAHLTTIGLISLQPYAIPLEVLAAIVYSKVLEEVKKRV